ncbi:hypothetical protein [Helicobacter sp.]|uniref:hypothetical protein n=1 Tax=Helicobacter sp. TaxID=218 RepID=UPI002A90DD5D|nr:hypothetical protein [Helicobacter sp.]MDY5557504.1 hypothetical protein [Helicobacter sp.]
MNLHSADKESIIQNLALKIPLPYLLYARLWICKYGRVCVAPTQTCTTATQCALRLRLAMTEKYVLRH